MITVVCGFNPAGVISGIDEPIVRTTAPRQECAFLSEQPGLSTMTWSADSDLLSPGHPRCVEGGLSIGNLLRNAYDEAKATVPAHLGGCSLFDMDYNKDAEVPSCVRGRPCRYTSGPT